MNNAAATYCIYYPNLAFQLSLYMAEYESFCPEI